MKGALGATVGAVSVTTASVLPVFLTGALAVQISAEMGFAPAGLGVVAALYFRVSALASLPAGWLVERYGAAVTSRIALIGVTVAMSAIAAFAHSYAALVTILLCCAWCNVLGQLSANLTLAEHVPAHRQGFSFGIKQAAIPIATLLSGAAVPAIALTVGWRWAYVLIAALALGAQLLAPRQAARLQRRSGKPEDRATGALSVLGVAAGLGAGAASGLGIFLVAAAVDRGISPGMAGLTLTFGSVVGLTLRLVHGWLADRREGGHIGFVAGSLLAGAAGLLLLAAPGPIALVIGVALGFGLGWSWPGLLQFAVVRLHPAAPAAATSIVQVGVYGGGFAGPIGFGFIATHGSFSAAWLTGAAAMLLAGALMILGRRMLTTSVPREVSSSEG